MVGYQIMLQSILMVFSLALDLVPVGEWEVVKLLLFPLVFLIGVSLVLLLLDLRVKEV